MGALGSVDVNMSHPRGVQRTRCHAPSQSSTPLPSPPPPPLFPRPPPSLTHKSTNVDGTPRVADASRLDEYVPAPTLRFTCFADGLALFNIVIKVPAPATGQVTFTRPLCVTPAHRRFSARPPPRPPQVVGFARGVRAPRPRSAKEMGCKAIR